MKFTFPLISALFLTLSPATLPAQEKAGAPIAEKKNTEVKKKVFFTKDGKGNVGFAGIKPSIGILIEYISLDSKKANTLLGEFTSKASDVAELRDALEQAIDKGDAELVETMWIRGRSGQRALTESVREDYYPTNYESPVLPYVGAESSSEPSHKKKGPGESEIHMTHAIPNTFDLKKIGSILEVDPILSSDHKLITLSLSPTIVTRLEDHYFTRKGFENSAWGVENVLMPAFYTMKDITQIEVAPGKYNLLGIHTPPRNKDKKILVLVRADLIPYH